MKTNLLFPSYFKYIGYLLAVPGLVLGYLFLFGHSTKFLSYGRGSTFGGNENYTDELAITLIVVGLFFIGFAANRSEDERSHACRSVALYRSVSVATIIVLCSFIAGLLPVANSGVAVLFMYFFVYQPLIFILLFNYFLYFNSDSDLKSAPPLPYKYFHAFGLFVLRACLLLRLVYACISYVNYDLLTVIYYVASIALLLLVFSKEKTENLVVDKYRSISVQIAVYMAAGIFLAATWVVYGIDYLSYMYTYPLYLLGAYAIIFQYKLYKNRKQTQDVVALT